MAYVHETIQQRMDPAAVAGTGITLGAAAKMGVVCPGLQPMEVRGVAYVVTTTCTVTAPVIGLYLRPTAGSDTSRTLVKSVTAPLASWAAGNTIYSNFDGIKVLPGQDILAEVITNPTAGAAFAIAMYHNSWDSAGNNTKMVASTT